MKNSLIKTMSYLSSVYCLVHCLFTPLQASIITTKVLTGSMQEEIKAAIELEIEKFKKEHYRKLHNQEDVSEPMITNYLFDERNVRYSLVKTSSGKPYNWLFIPGGPGADSSYYLELVKHLELPGNTWLIDLPGNGSNLKGVGENYDYNEWFSIFLETVKKFDNPILVGHSFGGMLPLYFPELEHILKGLVILNACPKGYEKERKQMLSEREPLAKKQEEELKNAKEQYKKDPSDANYKKCLLAVTPYFFGKKYQEVGKKLFDKLPFPARPGVFWLGKWKKEPFNAKWTPEFVPTLIVNGKKDYINPYTVYENDRRFQRDNIMQVVLEEGGHMSWIEDPLGVKEAFSNFLGLLDE